MKTIALTGATGNMGKETLVQLMQLNEIGCVNILVLNIAKDKRLANK